MKGNKKRTHFPVFVLPSTADTPCKLTEPRMSRYFGTLTFLVESTGQLHAPLGFG